jgi:hypothetical protein
VTQDTAEEATTPAVHTFSSLRPRPPQHRFQHTRSQHTRKNRPLSPLAQFVLSLSFTRTDCARIDFSQHDEPSQVRLPPTPGGSSRGATVPADKCRTEVSLARQTDHSWSRWVTPVCRSESDFSQMGKDAARLEIEFC